MEPTRSVQTAVLACSVLFLMGCSPKGETLRGTVTLHTSEGFVSGPRSECQGTRGYNDIGPGMSVTVRDGKGVILGATTTKAVNALPPERESILTGLLVSDKPRRNGIAYNDCTVWYEVPVANSEFYEVEIGKRGKQVYPRTELVQNGWVVSAVIGDGPPTKP